MLLGVFFFVLLNLSVLGPCVYFQWQFCSSSGPSSAEKLPWVHLSWAYSENIQKQSDYHCWKKSELVNNTVSILEAQLSFWILIFYNHVCCIYIGVSACMQGHNMCLEVSNSLQEFVPFFNRLGHMDQTWVVRFGRHLFLPVPLCWPADKFSCFK